MQRRKLIAMMELVQELSDLTRASRGNLPSFQPSPGMETAGLLHLLDPCAGMALRSSWGCCAIRDTGSLGADTKQQSSLFLLFFPKGL